MKDNYEHIHQATDKRLSEMLIFVADNYSRLMTHDENETLREASRRLKAYQNKPEIFNSEQFNL